MAFYHRELISKYAADGRLGGIFLAPGPCTPPSSFYFGIDAAKIQNRPFKDVPMLLLSTTAIRKVAIHEYCHFLVHKARIEQNRKLHIEGFAQDGEDVSELARRMNLSAYFAEVRLLPATRQTDVTTHTEVVSFALEAKVKY